MTTGKLAGRVALITGGASGIGQAAARVLAAEGAAVAIADCDEAGAEAVAAELRAQGGRATAYPLDVSQEPSWTECMERLLEEWERLDVAVNSAGISHARPVTELTVEEWERVMSVNLRGVFLGTQFAIRAMQPRGAGSIINISSTAGVRAIPGAAAYSVSKAGVCMLSRVAALECAKNGTRIRVNSVLPGGVKTPLWRQLDSWDQMVTRLGSEEAVFATFARNVPLKRYAEAEEVARAILYLASDDSAFATGTELVIDGGYAVS